MAFGFISPRPKSRVASTSAPLNSTSNISSPVPLPNSLTTFYPSRVPPPPSSVILPTPPITSRIPTSSTSRLPQPKSTTTRMPSTPPKSTPIPPFTPPSSRIPPRPRATPSSTPTPAPAPTPNRVLRKPSTGPNFLQRLTSPSLSSSTSSKPSPQTQPTFPPPSTSSKPKVPVLGLAIEWDKPPAPPNPKPLFPTTVAPALSPSLDDASSDSGASSLYHYGRSRDPIGGSLGRPSADNGRRSSKTWSRDLGEGTLKFGMERVLKLDERDGDGDTFGGSRGESGGGRGGIVRLDSTESVPRMDEFGVLDDRTRANQPSSPSSPSIRGFKSPPSARSSSLSSVNGNGGAGPQISAAFGTRRSISISPFHSSSLSVASSTSSSGAPVYFLNGIPRAGGAGGESRRGSIRAVESSRSSSVSSTFGDTRGFESPSPSPSPRADFGTLIPPPNVEDPPTPPIGFTPPSTRVTYTPPPLLATPPPIDLNNEPPSSPPLSPLSSPSPPLPTPNLPTLHRTISPPKSLASTRRPSSPPPPPRRLATRSTRPVPPLPTSPPFSLKSLLSDSEGWTVSISSSSSPHDRVPAPEGSLSYTITLSPPPPSSSPKQVAHNHQEHPTPLLTPSSSPQPSHSQLASSPTSARRATHPISPTSPPPSSFTQSNPHTHSFGYAGTSSGRSWKAPSRATMVNLVLPLGGAGGGKVTFLSLPPRGSD